MVWDAGTAVEGVYEVSVYFRLNCGGTADPVPFTLIVIEHGAVVDVISGELLREGDSYHTLLEITALKPLAREIERVYPIRGVS